MFGAVLTGATHYLERYMHPFFLLTPLWMLTLVERSGNASRKVVVLTAVLLSITVLVVPLRLRDLLHAMGARVPQMPHRRSLWLARRGASSPQLSFGHDHRRGSPRCRQSSPHVP
jgi:hypothetical protein